MSKKVEICGINTTTLPKLSSTDTQKLILELREGNELARNKLIEGNMRLVLSVLHNGSPMHWCSEIIVTGLSTKKRSSNPTKRAVEATALFL